MERDVPLTACFNVCRISTHTLTWSVTFWELGILNAKKISTHTLTWSVTVSKNGTRNLLVISTHTLTWSVTWRHFFHAAER